VTLLDREYAGEHPGLRKLILASASPRRREILTAAGIEFEALPASIQESQRQGESPEEFVLRLAAEKAEAALAQILPPWVLPILGADTVVVLDERVLGKPASAAEACQMLRGLSGRTHRVLTGVCLLSPAQSRPPGRNRLTKTVRLASTTVKFSELTEQEIQEYVASGEPFDKAGAYAIQGRASKYLQWIHGCYFNVVGLPISLVYQMLMRSEFTDPKETVQE
jgi:septum formation protein